MNGHKSRNAPWNTIMLHYEIPIDTKDWCNIGRSFARVAEHYVAEYSFG